MEIKNGLTLSQFVDYLEKYRPNFDGESELIECADNYKSILTYIDTIKIKEKLCSKCKKIKLVDQFCIKPSAKSGYTSHCKKCLKEKDTNYKRTKIGLIKTIHKQQRASSKHRCHVMPEYTSDELCSWVLSQDNFEIIYIEWVNSKYNTHKRPSIDRLYNDLPYTFDNIRLVTWKENHDKKRYYANK